MILIALALCCGYGRAPNFKEELIQNFLREDSAQPKYSPSLRHQARRLIKLKITNLQRAACEYDLALGPNPAPHVRKLVALASNDVNQIRDALPQALGRIYLFNPGPEVTRQILTTRLDGGPAETLASVRLEVLRRRPMPLVRYLRKLAPHNPQKLFTPTLRPQFTEDLVFFHEDDPNWVMLRRTKWNLQESNYRYLKAYLDLVAQAQPPAN